MASTASSCAWPSIFVKLVPFFVTVFIYFWYFIPSDQPSLFAVMVKCLPIVSLMLFLVLQGVSRDDKHKYTRLILLGLCFSVMGDGLLMWPLYFEIGIAWFHLAHLTYTWAFGFKTLNFALAAVLYSYGIYVMTLFWPNGKGVIAFFIPVYTTVVMTTTWRAIDRGQLFKGDLTWSRVSGAIGGIFFCISDSTISFNLLYTPIPHFQLIIMSTYYAAQLFIVLSTVGSNQVQEDQRATKQKYNKSVKTN